MLFFFFFFFFFLLLHVHGGVPLEVPGTSAATAIVGVAIVGVAPLARLDRGNDLAPAVALACGGGDRDRDGLRLDETAVEGVCGRRLFLFLCRLGHDETSMLYTAAAAAATAASLTERARSDLAHRTFKLVVLVVKIKAVGTGAARGALPETVPPAEDEGGAGCGRLLLSVAGVVSSLPQHRLFLLLLCSGRDSLRGWDLAQRVIHEAQPSARGLGHGQVLGLCRCGVGAAGGSGRGGVSEWVVIPLAFLCVLLLCPSLPFFPCSSSFFSHRRLAKATHPPRMLTFIVMPDPSSCIPASPPCTCNVPLASQNE